MMALVYGTLALPVAFRGWLRRAFTFDGTRRSQTAVSLAGLFTSGLLSSVLFFVITNFGVWCRFGTYDRSLAGLMHCYVAAIPFFRYTVAGDLFFSVMLFGSYALAVSLARRTELATQAS